MEESFRKGTQRNIHGPGSFCGREGERLGYCDDTAISLRAARTAAKTPCQSLLVIRDASRPPTERAAGAEGPAGGTHQTPYVPKTHRDRSPTGDARWVATLSTAGLQQIFACFRTVPAGLHLPGRKISTCRKSWASEAQGAFRNGRLDTVCAVTRDPRKPRPPRPESSRFWTLFAASPLALHRLDRLTQTRNSGEHGWHETQPHLEIGRQNQPPDNAPLSRSL